MGDKAGLAPQTALVEIEGWMRLKDGNSAQEHIKVMTELFDAVSVAGETISGESCQSPKVC